jgi:hypothetical protein
MLYAALHTVSFVHGFFAEKMHSDWFNGIEILQGRWRHGEKVGYCYHRGLENTLCKWDIYVPLVTKSLTNNLNLRIIRFETLLVICAISQARETAFQFHVLQEATLQNMEKEILVNHFQA